MSASNISGLSSSRYCPTNQEEGVSYHASASSRCITHILYNAAHGPLGGRIANTESALWAAWLRAAWNDGRVHAVQILVQAKADVDKAKTDDASGYFQFIMKVDPHSILASNQRSAAYSQAPNGPCRHEHVHASAETSNGGMQ